jgi:hypothetical protein
MGRRNRGVGLGAVLVIAAFAATAAGTTPAWSQGVGLFSPGAQESSGELEMQALRRAYPDQISEAAQRGGDWGVNVRGEWFLWAHGRVLPEPERGDWMSYGSYRFYRYPLQILPPVPQLSAEEAARLKKALEEARLHPPRRSEAFLERLLGAGSREETAGHIVTIEFLGFQVRVHERIAEPLGQVAAEIEILDRANPQVAAFLSGLAEIDGYNYRDVAGTRTRSYHGYGLAVDLIPRSYGGKAPYWRWVMGNNDQWWATPYERRWMLPLPIVAAFERHGFVWGGKWLFFDTMHFEYRPEILILAQGAGAP